MKTLTVYDSADFGHWAEENGMEYDDALGVVGQIRQELRLNFSQEVLYQQEDLLKEVKDFSFDDAELFTKWVEGMDWHEQILI